MSKKSSSKERTRDNYGEYFILSQEWNEEIINGKRLEREILKVDCRDCGCKIGEYHLLGCPNSKCPSCTLKLEECNCDAMPINSPDYKKFCLQDNIEVVKSLLAEACRGGDVLEIKDLVKKCFDYLYDSSTILKDL